MRGFIRLAVPLTAVMVFTFALVPLRSAPPKELTEDEMREKLLAKPFLEGKLTDVDLKGDEKTFLLKAVWEVKTPNVEGMKRFRQVARGLQQRGTDAKRNNNQAEYQKAFDEYMAARAAQYDVVETPIPFKLKAAPNFQFRRLELPDKEPGPDGKPGRYTEKEKADLKGKDPNIPGYKLDPKDLEDNAVVRVYLEKKKPTSTAPPKDKPADKDKAKEKEADPAEVVYTATIIMLVPEPKSDASNPFGK